MGIQAQIANSSGTGIRKGINKDGIYLLILTIPFVVMVFLFSYLPLFGWTYAFFKYRPGVPLSQTQFIGIAKFIEMFSNSERMFGVLRNTLILAFVSILAAPLPVVFAILLNETRSKRYCKVVQTLSTMPNFISWVIVYSFSFSIFSTEGLLNQILINMGIIKEPLNLLGNESIVWLFQPALLVWKTIGWNAIIYLAAIAGIDNELYDAAEIDGAGRYRKILHIIVPGVSATFIVLLLLSIGNLLNAGSGMEQYLVFYNSIVADKIEVLDLYVYRLGLVVNDYPLATAVGIFKTVISIMLLFTVNSVSKRIRGQSII